MPCRSMPCHANTHTMLCNSPQRKRRREWKCAEAVRRREPYVPLRIVVVAQDQWGPSEPTEVVPAASMPVPVPVPYPCPCRINACTPSVRMRMHMRQHPRAFRAESHPVPSHRIPSHPIASHRIPSHPIAPAREPHRAQLHPILTTLDRERVVAGDQVEPLGPRAFTPRSAAWRLGSESPTEHRL
jgi:hypothetical protein